MDLNIRGKIVLISVAMLALSIGANAAVTSIIFTREYSLALQSRAFVLGGILKSQLDRLLRLKIPIQDLVGFEEQCAELVTRYKDISYVMVVSLDGKILFHNDPSQHGQFQSDSALLRSMKSHNEGLYEYSRNGADFYDFVLPVFEPDGTHIASVRIGFPSSLISEKLTGMLTHSIGVALVLIVLGIVLLITGLKIWVIKPIHKLMAVITDIRQKGASSGQLVKINSNDELGQMSSIFNEMIFEIRESHKKMENYTKDLEAKVQERTAELRSANKQLEQDIIRRKRAEETLRESEEKYRTILEGIEEGYYETDLAGNFTFLNDSACKIHGYSKDELMGANYKQLVAPEMSERVYQFFNEAYRTGSPTDGANLEVIGPGGDTRHLESSISLMKDAGGHRIGFRGIVRDITERKRRADKIKASLKEKEILLGEIHHRVKNNLQIVSSLLMLQSDTVEDKQSLEVLNESQNRVKSMALAHELLYRSEDLGHIAFDEYVQELMGYLSRSYAHMLNKLRISAIVEKGLSLDIDKAIPLGLIINELVSNALKHAFPDGDKDHPFRQGQVGEIHVELRHDNDLPLQRGADGELMLLVSDNGAGFPEDLDFRKTGSLGLQLVTSLTEQLGGVIELDRSHGTGFKIAFPS